MSTITPHRQEDRMQPRECRSRAEKKRRRRERRLQVRCVLGANSCDSASTLLKVEGGRKGAGAG
jgi:hypothetical protein